MCWLPVEDGYVTGHRVGFVHRAIALLHEVLLEGSDTRVATLLLIEARVSEHTRDEIRTVVIESAGSRVIAHFYFAGLLAQLRSSDRHCSAAGAANVDT